MNPLVSIIIPTYNRAEYITDCLLSVKNQTYRPIEVFVVDDGSSDQTEERVNSLMRKWNNDPHFKVTYQKTENLGAPHARNYGFRKSVGDFITFLDSDDLLKPEKICTQLKFLQADSYDMVYSRNQRITPEGKPIKQLSGRELTHDERDLYSYSWQTMCALYTRSYVETIGPWDEDLPISQDWDYCIRAILAGGKIGFQNKALQWYRYHNSGRIGTTKSLKAARGRELAYTRNYQRIITLNKLSKPVERKYFRMLFQILLLYTSRNQPNDVQRLTQFIGSNFDNNTLRHLALRISRNRIIAGSIITIHSTLTRSKKFLIRRLSKA